MAKAKTEKSTEIKKTSALKVAPKVAKKTSKKTTAKTNKADAMTEAPEMVAQTDVQEVQADGKTEKVGKGGKTKKATRKVPKAEAAEKANAELQAKSKQEIIEMFATKDGDTGSPEVQIALTTQKIYNLSQHLQENPKDNHSRRGLLKIIAKRRRILHYLQDKNDARYIDLIGKLGLKK